MLENNSTVLRQITNRINSQNSAFETTQLKELPLNTFVIHTNVNLSNSLRNSNPFELAYTKLSNNFLLFLMTLRPKMALHLIPIELIFYHTILKNCLFSHTSGKISQLLLFLIFLIQTLIKNISPHLNLNLKRLLIFSIHTPLLKLSQYLNQLYIHLLNIKIFLLLPLKTII